MARKKSLRRKPVDEKRLVYRVVDTDSMDAAELAPYFSPDKDDPNKEPNEREVKYPILQEGLSAFSSEEFARRRWAGMRKNATQFGEDKVRQGDFLAEVELIPGKGFFVEDRERRDGHLTIWGDPLKLATATCRVFPAKKPKEEADD